MTTTTRRLLLSLALVTSTIALTASTGSAGPSGGALPPVLIEALDVTELAGVPADARMVAANVTAVEPNDAGFVTVWPCDEDRPLASNVNYVADQIVPNLVLSRIDADGFICVYTLATADIVVDVVGYVPAGSQLLPLPSPARIIDTRELGPDPIAGGTTLDVTIAGIADVPSDAGLAVFNLTAIAGPQPGFLSVYPCDEPRPDTSSVNYPANGIVPNLVTSRLAADGSVCVHALTDADIVIDVAAHASGGIETLDAPVRIVDTRDDGPVSPGGQTLDIDITGRADVPDDASAAVYNLTSTESTAAGFATSHPCDEPRPLASNLNHTAGQNVANGAITKLSADGRLCIYHLVPTHLIVDLIGYTTGAADYVPITPVRIWDTREGWERTCDWAVLDPELGGNPAIIRVVDFMTGDVVTLTDALARPTVAPIVNDTCDAVVYYEDGVHVRRFDGGRLDLPPPPAAESSFIRSVHSVGGEILIGNEGGELFDAVTGELVWAGPNPSEMIDDMAIAPTGVAVITFENFEDPSVPSRAYEVWDIFSDTRLFGGEAVGGVGRISLSPDGRYFTVEVGDDVLVVTIFGDVVDGLTEIPVAVAPLFVGNGQLVMCADFNGIYLWDLYGPVVRVLDWAQWTSATGQDFCGLNR